MHQYATLEDTLYLYFASNDTSGSGGDGASAAADVREGGAAASAIPTLSPTPSLLSHANYPAGCYEVAVDATDANGFSADKTYAVFCTLAVDSQNPTGFIGSFRLSPVPSNIIQISDDAPAAVNLESQYDETGITGPDFPAKQSQVSNLTVAGSASKTPALLSPNGFVIAFGENEANNEDATRPLDGTTHDIEAQDDTGTEKIDVYYEMNVGAGIPSEVTWHGRLDRGGGASKNIVMQVQDVDAATWRTVGTIISSTSLETDTFDIFINEVGTGSDLGTVRIRFLTGSVAFTATTKLLTDQIFVSFNTGAISDLNAVYFDSGAGNTGTSSIDGVPGNPVSTEAAVNTLLAARNLHRVEVALDSSITFATSHINEVWTGIHWTLANGGQNLSGSHFIGADVTGIATASADPIGYKDCDIGTCTLAQFHMKDCEYNGIITFGEAGDYLISGSNSRVAGAATPIFDTGAALGNVNFSVSGWDNGFELRNLNATGVDLFSISGKGQIIYAASCSGTVNQRGDWKVTNTGGVTIVADDNTTKIAATLDDTNELQTDDVPGLIGALQDLSAADVAGELATYDGPTKAEMDSAHGLLATEAKQDIIDGNIDTLVARIIGTLAAGTHNPATAAEIATLADWINGGRLDLLLDLIKVVTDAQGKVTIPFTAEAGTLSTTQMTTNLTITDSTQLNDRVFTFDDDTITVALRGQQVDITASVAAGGMLTFPALTTAPAVGDTGLIT